MTKKNVRISDIPAEGKPASAETSKTLYRGLSLMNALLQAPPEGLRVVDLCRQTGLSRSAVHRLLGTLVAGGYAAPVSRFHYVAGEKWEPLLPTERRRKDLSAQLSPVMAEISEQCGDASFAVVREGSLSLCIARQVGTHPVQALVIKVGTKQPLGVGAAGLALLASLTQREIDMVIEANRGELGMYGSMTAEALRRLVEATRERGWSVVGNHAVKGVLAVGLPVFNAAGVLLGGLSVATTAERFPIARQKQVASQIANALRRHGFATSSRSEPDAPLKTY